MKTDNYNRKISAKEAQEGFIFILKEPVKFFPQFGDKFELTNDGLIKELV